MTITTLRLSVSYGKMRTYDWRDMEPKTIYFNIPMVAMMNYDNLMVVLSDMVDEEDMKKNLFDSIIEHPAWTRFISELNEGGTWLNVQLDASSMSDPYGTLPPTTD